MTASEILMSRALEAIAEAPDDGKWCPKCDRWVEVVHAIHCIDCTSPTINAMEWASDVARTALFGMELSERH